MNTNALATAVAAKAAGITGLRGYSAAVPDTIPASPWLIVGSHSATTELSGTVTTFTFPLRCYVERTSDSARTQVIVNDLVDDFVAAYWDGLTYGGTIAVGRITGWNTDLYAEVGQADYQVVEFTFTALVRDTTVHTP